jgi:hypothetical protein
MAVEDLREACVALDIVPLTATKAGMVAALTSAGMVDDYGALLRWVSGAIGVHGAPRCKTILAVPHTPTPQRLSQRPYRGNNT